MQHGAQDADRVLVKHHPHRCDVEAAQDRSVRAPYFAACRDNPPMPDGIAKAQLSERVHRIGRKKKGESKFARGSRTLEDPDVPTRSSQRNSRRQTADARSDNKGLRHPESAASFSS
jgi:hypothetical protein